MNKKRLVFIFPLFLAFQFCFAQENLLQGYLLKSNGEKLEGFIDYQKWNINPTSFTFRKSAKSQSQVFSSKENEISEFHIKIKKGEEVYLRRIVLRNKLSQKSDALSSSVEPEMELDTVFLKVFERGAVSLYYLRESVTEEHYFIESTGNPITELIYHKYKYYDAKKLSEEYKINSKYRQQLSKIFSNNNDIYTNDIPKLTYTEKDLRKIITKYNRVNPTDFSFSYVENKPKIEFGVFGGLSQNFGTLHYTVFTKGQDMISGNITPILGVLGALKINKHWLFYNELFYKNYELVGDTKLLDRTILGYSKSTATFKYDYLKVVTGVKYRINLNQYSSVNFTLGFVSGIMLSGQNSLSFIDDYGRFNSVEIFPSVRKLENGLMLGAGYEINKMIFGLRFEASNGMSPVAVDWINVYSLNFMVGYAF
jgi:Outer membrane protein beta-barrel domain